MHDLTIGLIQTHQYWEDKNANFNHFGPLIRKTCSDQVPDLILLPEMFNTGFSMNGSVLAEKMNGPSISWLTSVAEELNSRIAATLIIREQESLFNRFVIVGSQGIEAHYDKRHLFRMAGENKVFTSGNKRIIYELCGWKIMLQTCYDLRFPVFSRNKLIDGHLMYDLVLYLANWPSRRDQVWRTLLQARAIENQSWCIGVNRTGTDGSNLAYSGNSMIINPWGSIEVDCANSSEAVKIYTISAAVLDDARSKFPVFLDAD